jgi:hypothetical protein
MAVSGRPVIWVSAAVAVLVVAGTAGVLMVRSQLRGGPPAPSGSAAPVAGSAASPSVGAAETAARFLADWAAGRADAAARRTDDPPTAAAALREWAAGLHAGGVRISPRPATDSADGPVVPFDVALTAGRAGWRYASSLSLDPDSAGWLVRWSPSVLHPRLTDDTVLRLGPVPGGRRGLVDRSGRSLPANRYPSLTGIARRLAARYPAAAGRSGLAVQVVDRYDGTASATLAVLTRPAAGAGVASTFDAGMQAAAERATAGHPASGLVVLQPSTGAILAVANAPATGTDLALLARLAPGSTMKVITTAALLAAGVTPGTVVPCPDTVTVNGKVFHNADGVVTGTLPLHTDFARSCNTAFIGLRDRLSGGALTDQATAVFGLTAWDIGLGDPVAYGSVPAADDPVIKAADMIGQGTVGMSPLAMASVAATVANGSFTQPVLRPDAPRVRAARPLPAGTAAALRGMMREVVTAGTARRSLGDLPGSVHAKTGTAEAPGGDNGWLIGYRGDLAFGCLVEGGGHGADSCGPLVRQFLLSVR